MEEEQQRGAGRPKLEIDFEQVKKLCFLHCTKAEIAGYLDISVDTLDRRLWEVYDCNFAAFFSQHSAGGKISLRRLQFKSAEHGSVPMQIWLGKQHLGQSEKFEPVRPDPQSSLPDSLKSDDEEPQAS